MFDRACIHAVVEIRYHRDFSVSRRYGGGYVNCWLLAENHEEAHRRIISAIPSKLRADVVSFSHIGPGNPREILVENLEVLATSHVRHLGRSLALAADRLRIWDDPPGTETMRRMKEKAGRCDLMMD